MSTPTKTPIGDVFPVAGGCPVPAAVLRKNLPDLPADADDLTLHLLRLFSLHPGLASKLQAPDISAMTKDDKLTLLGEINDALGIKPLKSA
jgi:hypothetical protein